MRQHLLLVGWVNLASVHVHVEGVCFAWWSVGGSTFKLLDLQVDLGILSDVIQSNVEDAAFEKFIELLSNFLKIIGWTIIYAETLLEFTYYFWDIFDFLLVAWDSIKIQVHTNEWHYRQDVSVEIRFSARMASYSLYNSENTLLCSNFKEVHLLQNYANCATSQYSFGVFNYDLLIRSDTRFWQINEAKASLH